jgi:hypothetical protein
MKRTIVLSVLVVMLASISMMAANPSATGTLTVTASVQPVITLTLSGASLTAGNGTAAATLALGNVSATGVAPSGVTEVVNANNFTLSAPIGVTVQNYNNNSAAYTLTAALALAPANGITWGFGSVANLSTTAANVTTTGAYGTTPTTETFLLTIPFTANSGTVGTPLAVSNTINLSATAN